MKKSKRIISNIEVNELGQFLAARELCKQGYSVKILDGSNEFIDMMALDGSRKEMPILVYVKRKGDWQPGGEKFLNIEKKGKKQKILSKKPIPEEVVSILVKIGRNGKPNEFRLLPLRELQEKVYRSYDSYLRMNNGIKPNFHTKITEDDLTYPVNNWDMIKNWPASTALPTNREMKP